MALLSSYDWPGNVRQLENAVFRAVVLAEGDDIGVGEFPQIAAQVQTSNAAASPDPPSAVATAERPEPLLVAPGIAAGETGAPLAGSAPEAFLLDAAGEVRPMEDIEADAIRFAITRYRGQMSEVARKLRIGRSTLYRKLCHLGLDTDAGKEPAGGVAAK